MAGRGESGGARAAGVALVVGSAILFSLTGVLTKTIESGGWTILCWRGLIGGAAIALYVLCRRRGRPARAAFRLGWRGWLLATVGGLASLAFIFAFKLTYVTNVVVIYATAPFMAAVLERLLLGEPFRLATLAAAGLSVLGIVVMVSGESAGGINPGIRLGDGLALLMTFGCALYMVLIRLYRDTPAVLAGGVSGLQLFLVGWLVVDPLAVSARDAILLALFGLSFALAVVLWTEGTRRLPAAESGLLGTAETPFAILFAWLILAELPPPASLLGGAVVLAAVFAHAGRDFVLAVRRRAGAGGAGGPRAPAAAGRSPARSRARTAGR